MKKEITIICAVLSIILLCSCSNADISKPDTVSSSKISVSKTDVRSALSHEEIDALILADGSFEENGYYSNSYSEQWAYIEEDGNAVVGFSVTNFSTEEILATVCNDEYINKTELSESNSPYDIGCNNGYRTYTEKVRYEKGDNWFKLEVGNPFLEEDTAEQYCIYYAVDNTLVMVRTYYEREYATNIFEKIEAATK